MREFTVVVIGALFGSMFAFAVAYLYVAGIRRLGPQVFRTWRVLLLFPVHCLFALSQAAPMLVPVSWLQRMSAPYLADNALFAITLVFGIVGFIPPMTYFFRQWSQLRAAGYWRTAKV